MYRRVRGCVLWLQHIVIIANHTQLSHVMSLREHIIIMNINKEHGYFSAHCHKASMSVLGHPCATSSPVALAIHPPSPVEDSGQMQWVRTCRHVGAIAISVKIITWFLCVCLALAVTIYWIKCQTNHNITSETIMPIKLTNDNNTELCDEITRKAQNTKWMSDQIMKIFH